ncbi:MAG: helix-turn-helix domain-containing protein [Planctomycetota bacterium]|jgi:excisionase family DNA binding protein
MNDTGFPIVLTPLAVDETQAAKMLGISVRTLWEYRKNGEIPVVRLGRLVRFSVDDLRKFIESKRVGMVSNAKPRE